MQRTVHAASFICLMLAAACGGDTPVAPLAPASTSTGLRFPVDSYAVRVGQVTPLAAVLRDARGRALNPAKVSWSSSEPTIAAVTGDGTAVGVAPGTAWIVATSGSLSARLRMVVSQVPVAVVSFQEAPAELVNGSAVQLRAIPRDSSGGALTGRPVSYSSSDTTVATISAGGLLDAVGVGTVTVAAESEGRRGELVLRVVAQPVATVELSPSALALEVGGSARLTVVLRDARGELLASRPVAFRSSDGTVAMVDAEGVVSAAGVGSAAIVVEVEGRSASASVSVRTADIGPQPTPDVPGPSPSAPPSTIPPPPLAGGPGDGRYTIETRFVGTPDSRAEAVIGQAAARWTAAIAGDLPDATIDMPAGSCYDGQPASRETIDDVVIFVRVVDIDGSGNVLARAGPCFIRAGSGLPLAGVIELDRADVGRDPRMVLDVVTHEMGHVLGIGTLWSFRSLVHGRGGGDPVFLGETTRAAYAELGGGSALVPVENGGGSGTAGSHWRETTFRAELMTGWINGGVNALSSLTIASLRDLGYGVRMGAAEAYSLPVAGGATARLAGASGMPMRDELIVPRFTVDSDGRTRRIDW